jgi:2-keto-4-pentenoate hydratase/2-oxohepta-3-ene-1,7-dioic acid hydratase in catechol pathway
MTSYKLVMYDAGEGARAGIVVNDRVLDVAACSGGENGESVRSLLDNWAAAKVRLSILAASSGGLPNRPLGSVKLLAPIDRPGTIYCAGANYKDHVLEMARAQNIAPEPDPHDVPGLQSWHFIKAPGCVIGPNEIVHLPPRSNKVDWEAELAVIIGRTAKDVPVNAALDYIAGYTIADDLSARDFTKRAAIPDSSPFKYDWVAHKCFDGSCPIGPWIVPAEEITDPQNLAIELSIGGVIKQKSNTSHMIFTVAEQTSHLSGKLTLHPGDIILTGTPAGVGAPRGEFLKRGDEVRITVEGVGELVNKIA